MGYAADLIVPTELVRVLLQDGQKRFICSINNAVDFHCAIQSRGAQGYAIMVSKRLQKAADIDIGEELAVTLLPDESEYGLPLPEEWAEVLAIDEEAAVIFKGLTPGRQRSILHLVGVPKREETRIQRALHIAENLKLGIRQPKDFLKK